MAQVKFLKGTQNNLNLLNNYTADAFYLTNDTNRLYFAQSSSELVPLNQFITVSDQDHLPKKGSGNNYNNIPNGEYYYVEDGNMLLRKDSNTSTGWIQLNPDTTLTGGTAFDISNTTVSNGVELAVDVSDSRNTHATGAVQIIGGANVTVTSDTSSSTDKIYIASTDTNTTYELSTATVSSNLNTNESAVTLNLNETNNNNNNITISNITIKSANSLIEIEKDDINSNTIILTGHGSSSVGSVSASFTETGALDITVDGVSSFHENNSLLNTIPTIIYGDSTATRQTAVFNDDAELALDVYTTSQVDSKINTRLASFDALKYEGTISNSDVATTLTDTANWGLVYKVASGGLSSGGYTAKTGDLIISRKTSTNSVEGAQNGTSWDIVPSGDEQTINFPSASTTTGKVSIDDGTNGAGIIVNAGGGMSVTYSLDSDNTLTATLSQAAITNAPFEYSGNGGNIEQSTGGGSVASNAVKAITGITTDTYGNVTSITQETITIKDSHAHPSLVETEIENITDSNNQIVNNAVQVTTTITDTDVQSAEGDFIIKSNNSCLSIIPDSTDNTNKTILIGLNWETF